MRSNLIVNVEKVIWIVFQFCKLICSNCLFFTFILNTSFIVCTIWRGGRRGSNLQMLEVRLRWISKINGTGLNLAGNVCGYRSPVCVPVLAPNFSLIFFWSSKLKNSHHLLPSSSFRNIVPWFSMLFTSFLLSLSVNFLLKFGQI